MCNNYTQTDWTDRVLEVPGWAIDHAPLFPPASLPPVEAVAAHVRACQSRRAIWLRSLVWPLDRLPELEAVVGQWGAIGPFRMSLVVAGAGDPALRDVQARCARFGGVVSQLEVACAPTAVEAALPRRVTVFEELAVAGSSESAIGASVSDLASRRADPDRHHAKVRCGGAPCDVPTPVELATFIHHCARRGVQWKATAGLHHATPDFAASQPHHGLANLIAAAAASTRHASVEEIRRLLEDPSPPVPAGRVAGDAARVLHSVGSCSFDEPLESLSDLASSGP